MINPHTFSSQLNASVSSDAQPALGITFDSRACNPQTAFAALRGEHRHGNEFIEAALASGAPFILTDLDVPRAVRVADATTALRRWGRLQRDALGAELIGITGSAGKTTAKTLVSSALDSPTTPGNLNTLNYLACYLLSNVSRKSRHIIEMGIDRIGEMNELMELVAPNVGVVTAVGPAHIEFFGSIQNIAYEKGQILQAPFGLVAGSVCTRYPDTPSYGFLEHCTYRASDVVIDEQSVRFRYAGHLLCLPTPSLQVAESAVLALALAEHYGVPLEQAVARLEKAQIGAGRFNIIRGKITLIDDAYNANPLSVAASLETLARFKERKVAILGHMRELGEHSRAYHSEVGAIAGTCADLVIAVGEHGDALAQAALEQGADTLWYRNTAEAKARFLADLKEGDVVLVKGSRYVQLEQLVEVLREHF
ncbi:MAG: UDP-N-acetylmuramoyl-tripeptide--D-alanyl-D-alanine ligase [Deinococcales bacterium]